MSSSDGLAGSGRHHAREDAGRGRPPKGVGRRDDPETYIPGDRRRALAAGVAMPDRVLGAAMFADISGFTPLTEALAAELGAQRGAEELTAVLETVFSEVLGELHRYGGNVIYFSGDAVTCWIDGDDGRLATRCAIGMQEAMDRVGTVATPGGRHIRLAMKVAVAVGPARRFVVGDPSIQLIDVLAGALMDDLAAAEHAAAKGEVVVDESVIWSLSSQLECSEQRANPESGRVVGVVRRLTVDVAPVPPPPPQARLPEDIVRQWLLPPVYERMRSGRGEFLAELRPAIPLFVRFGGLDFDADDSSNTWLRCSASSSGAGSPGRSSHARQTSRQAEYWTWPGHTRTPSVPPGPEPGWPTWRASAAATRRLPWGSTPRPRSSSDSATTPARARFCMSPERWPRNAATTTEPPRRTTTVTGSANASATSRVWARCSATWPSSLNTAGTTSTPRI
ncbi:MAG: adenylate/guanylate cyclase domain-containing protein [Actinomycetota bacterium]|nr:adenylate/guanylate cyclase domain-containing protein [Actinomycetota bacterium]